MPTATKSSSATIASGHGSTIKTVKHATPSTSATTSATKKTTTSTSTTKPKTTISPAKSTTSATKTKSTTSKATKTATDKKATEEAKKKKQMQQEQEEKQKQQEEEAAAKKKKAEEEAKAEEEKKKNLIYHFPFPALIDTVVKDSQRIWHNSNKYPLVLDDTERHCTFFRHSGHRLLDQPSCLKAENLRLMILTSLRFGTGLIIDVSPSAPFNHVVALEEAFENVSKGLWEKILSGDPELLYEKEFLKSLIKKEDMEELHNLWGYNQKKDEFFVCFLGKTLESTNELYQKRCFVMKAVQKN